MQNMTILIADDDPVIRKLFATRLGREGYTVTAVADGLEAARLLDTTIFDVVITDLVMPGHIGGIELLKIAREKSSGIEVIVITAHSSIDTAVTAMKKGAVDYLEKPVNFDELFLRLEKIAEVKSLVKNAVDLREAMDVTESSAADTIQTMEMKNSEQQILLVRLETILNDRGAKAEQRIEQVLNLLASRQKDMDKSPTDSGCAVFSRLVGLVDTLRGEGGCPWDIKQTPISLRKYLLEECQELAVAIDSGSEKEIEEEIGDVFFILTMLTAMFTEQGHFTVDDVLAGIIAKMIRRHPHVFSDAPLLNERELRAQWQRIKAQEKQSHKPPRS